LPRDKRVAVVRVLDRALRRVRRRSDVVVRPHDQTRAFALQERAHGFDLPGRGLLLGDRVVQPEDQERIGVTDDALVDGQSEARLIDALEHGHRISSDLFDHLLESDPCPEEELERA
jgi:hypothetical protein